MLATRPLPVRFFMVLTLLTCASLVPEARAVTVYQTTNTNWTVASNWDNGLPDAGDPGVVPGPRIALADGLIPSANITVQSGGTVRITSTDQVISSGNSITVENGGRLEYVNSTGTLADHNVINLMNGASIGRDNSGTDGTLQMFDEINIVGATSTVYFRETNANRSSIFSGPITGGANTTLIGENEGSANGIIVISAATNNTFAGKTIVRSSNGIQVGRLGAGGENPLGTGAAGPVEVQDMGVLRLRANTGVTGTGAIRVLTGGRIELEGPSSGNFISLQTGSTLGRGETDPSTGSSSDSITLDAGASVIFGGVESSRRLNLSGLITADVNSDILVQNIGSNAGYLQISSTTGNAIDGEIIVSGSSETTRGRLSAGGTNPLGTGLANHVVVQNFGTLELRANTGVQSTTDIIEIQSGGRIEFDAVGGSSGNRILMADNTALGRVATTNGFSTSTDSIEMATGANIEFFGGNASNRKQIYSGPISGSNVTITMSNAGTLDEELRISSATGNALSGQMIVRGDSAVDRGVLGLVGTQPLGTMDLEIQAFGTVVANAGSLDNQPNVTVLEDGLLRFRAGAGSTYANSTLRGTGLVRAETTSDDELSDTALQALTLNEVTLSPGTSAGTLTIEATTLTLDAASTLEVELGADSDLLAVEGNLDLTSGPTLRLLALDDLEEGEYVIATYSGALTGMFGTVEDLLGGSFSFASIDYGTLSNSQITVTIEAVLPVPEPNTGLLAVCGLVGLLVRRRVAARRGR